MKAKEGDCYAVDLQDVSTHCTINGGTFVGNISAVYVLQGNLTVNAGNFSIHQLPTDVNDERRTLDCYNDYCTGGTARITVTGGTFNKFDPANGDDNVPGTFVANGYESIANADGTYTVQLKKFFSIFDSSSVTAPSNEYVTLQEAVDNVSNNGWIRADTDGSATVSREVSFTVEERFGDHQISITAGSGYRLATSTGEFGNVTYTITREYTNNNSDSGSSSSNTTTTTEKNPDGSTTTTTTNKTTGTVAVIVDADGNETIVQTSVVTEDGVALVLDGSATVKIIDNTKVFADVQPMDHWAEDAIAFVSSRELFNGKTADTFAPNDPTTRAQLMTVLARMDGADTTGAALEKGMEWAVETGVSDGTNPSGTITRQQLAAMLYRYAQQNGEGFEGQWAFRLDYPDADKVADYAYETLCWCTMNGIVNGKADGTLDPNGLATRAQVAAMVQRFCSTQMK